MINSMRNYEEKTGWWEKKRTNKLISIDERAGFDIDDDEEKMV